MDDKRTKKLNNINQNRNNILLKCKKIEAHEIAETIRKMKSKNGIDKSTT